jgi:2-pyrone-4,6-dicarboxylate lactonase
MRAAAPPLTSGSDIGSVIDNGIAAGAASALLIDATDCDFRTSGSAAHDRVVLGEAGIGRIVVDFAHWPKLAEGGWRGAIRGVIDESALAEAGDLRRLHERGVRAVRVRMNKPADAEALPALADRIVGLNWHIEIDAPLNANAALLAPAEWTLAQMPVALCFAKAGGYDPRLPLDHPDVALLFELVRVGRGWIKLSDASHASAQPAGDFRPFVAALLECRNDRIVWGSGIRHERGSARALSTGLEYMVCDAAERGMILSHNPARLYGFGET